MQAKTNPGAPEDPRGVAALLPARRSCSTRAARRSRRSLAACPTGDLRMGANPHVNGGKLRKAAQAPRPGRARASTSRRPGADDGSALMQLGEYFADVFRLNADERNFRIVCPDEVASNRLGAVFEATDHACEWPLDPEIDTGPRARRARSWRCSPSTTARAGCRATS